MSDSFSSPPRDQDIASSITRKQILGVQLRAFVATYFLMSCLVLGVGASIMLFALGSTVSVVIGVAILLAMPSLLKFSSSILNPFVYMSSPMPEGGGIWRALGYGKHQAYTTSLVDRLKEYEGKLAKQRETDGLPGEKIAQEIDLSLQQERLSMWRAQKSAERSSAIGQLLFVLGLLAPVVAGLVYILISPTPQYISSETFNDITVDKLENIPQAMYQRDWRILLAGVSFGFLFLASGAGLLKESRQKMHIYFRLAKRVAQIENYLLAFRVSQRTVLESTDVKSGLAQVASKLVAQLIETDVRYGEGEVNRSDDTGERPAFLHFADAFQKVNST